MQPTHGAVYVHWMHIVFRNLEGDDGFCDRISVLANGSRAEKNVAENSIVALRYKFLTGLP